MDILKARGFQTKFSFRNCNQQNMTQNTENIEQKLQLCQGFFHRNVLTLGIQNNDPKFLKLIF